MTVDQLIRGAAADLTDNLGKHNLRDMSKKARRYWDEAMKLKEALNDDEAMAFNDILMFVLASERVMHLRHFQPK